MKFGKTMSRIGQKPITIPEGVKAEFKDGLMSISGPKGSLTLKVRPEMKVEIKEGSILVSRKTDSLLGRALHGLTRTLIDNMIKGVTASFSKSLEIIGTGYRAVLDGEILKLSVGFTHPVSVNPPAGISFQVKENLITVIGIDKGLVGQVAADIRRVKVPDAYKGKGIRYQGEVIKTKAGKAGKAGTTAGGFTK